MSKPHYSTSTDSELLIRFQDKGDNRAFAELIGRHGPMVCAVARRVLRKPEDVQDAVQATMFALARSAGKLRNRAAIAGWLHKVAYSCAVEIQRSNVRWQRKTERIMEHELSTRSERRAWNPEETAANAEIEAMIDEELADMSEKLRLAVVLCDMQGWTHQEAAKQLGLASSTLGDRLVKGRRILRNRLERRGFTISVAGLGVLTSTATKRLEAMPIEVATDIAAKARLYTAGKSASDVGVSPSVVHAANKVTLAMIKAKAITVSLIAVFLVMFGSYIVDRHGTWSTAAAQLRFGEPIKTANVNLDAPIWDQQPRTSSDGLSLYLTSRQRPGPEYPVGDFYLYVATRNSKNDPWSTPQPLPVELNQGGDGGASLSSDSLALYFSRGGEFGPSQGSDLYLATRESMEMAWNDPQPVPVVNTGFSDIDPDISSNGLELYFASDRPGGQGNWDLWVSRRSSLLDTWSEPENLGLLNSTGTESGPDLSEDGLTLFYSSNGPDPGRPVQSGDIDLWVVNRDTLTSPWQDPVRLPDSINEFPAVGPHLSSDGSTLYFARSTLDSSDLFAAAVRLDIWQVPVVAEPSTALTGFSAVLVLACCGKRVRASIRRAAKRRNRE